MWWPIVSFIVELGLVLGAVMSAFQGDHERAIYFLLFAIYLAMPKKEYKP